MQQAGRCNWISYLTFWIITSPTTQVQTEQEILSPATQVKRLHNRILGESKKPMAILSAFYRRFHSTLDSLPYPRLIIIEKVSICRIYLPYLRLPKILCLHLSFTRVNHLTWAYLTEQGESAATSLLDYILWKEKCSVSVYESAIECYFFSWKYMYFPCWLWLCFNLVMGIWFPLIHVIPCSATFYDFSLMHSIHSRPPCETLSTGIMVNLSLEGQNLIGGFRTGSIRQRCHRS